MTFVAGCDVGSLTSKAVIMADGKIVSWTIMKSKARPWESADAVMNETLSKAKLAMKDIEFCVGTGYGREKIPFVNETSSEIACHARGARWLVPGVRTVIDIGGQDCKAMKLDEKGDMMKFITNDKCASGTGRFLEVMAKVLGVRIEDLGPLSMKSKNPVTFATACTVWAQADVIQHVNDGVPTEDIASGINTAMAARMAVLAGNIGFEREVCMTGGVAKNEGVVTALEKILGVKIRRVRKADPQITGALGAALFAQEKLGGTR
jgi:predicted CoA-substrate-specific enzyme activase